MHSETKVEYLIKFAYYAKEFHNGNAQTATLNCPEPALTREVQIFDRFDSTIPIIVGEEICKRHNKIVNLIKKFFGELFFIK